MFAEQPMEFAELRLQRKFVVASYRKVPFDESPEELSDKSDQRFASINSAQCLHAARPPP